MFYTGPACPGTDPAQQAAYPADLAGRLDGFPADLANGPDGFPADLAGRADRVRFANKLQP